MVGWMFVRLNFEKCKEWNESWIWVWWLQEKIEQTQKSIHLKVSQREYKRESRTLSGDLRGNEKRNQKEREKIYKTQTIKKSNQKREITNNKQRKEGRRQRGDRQQSKANKAKFAYFFWFNSTTNLSINQSIIWIFLFNSIDFCIFERFLFDWRELRRWETTDEICSIIPTIQ